MISVEGVPQTKSIGQECSRGERGMGTEHNGYDDPDDQIYKYEERDDSDSRKVKVAELGRETGNELLKPLWAKEAQHWRCENIL
jgi:hypothetical protein